MNTSSRASDQQTLLAVDIKDLLRHWYLQKFVQKRDTASLMAVACNLRDKHALGIVALMDVEPQVIGQVMDETQLPFVHSCHAYLRSPEFQQGLCSGI